MAFVQERHSNIIFTFEIKPLRIWTLTESFYRKKSANFLDED